MIATVFPTERLDAAFVFKSNKFSGNSERHWLELGLLSSDLIPARVHVIGLWQGLASKICEGDWHS